MNTVPFFVTLGVLTAIAATVLAFIFILPEKKREGLPDFFKMIHDFLNMKELFIEKFLRVIYVFLTLACIVVGALMIFGFQHHEGFYTSYTRWYGGYGVMLAIVGPIVIRIAFEVSMMFILLVKNTIAINNKLKDQNDAKTVETPEEE